MTTLRQNQQRTVGRTLRHKQAARKHGRDSSDLLLVLLLPKVGNYIVSSSGEAVSDGVARLRWFAARFQELSKVESGGLS